MPTRERQVEQTLDDLLVILENPDSRSKIVDAQLDYHVYTVSADLDGKYSCAVVDSGPVVGIKVYETKNPNTILFYAGSDKYIQLSQESLNNTYLSNPPVFVEVNQDCENSIGDIYTLLVQEYSNRKNKEISRTAFEALTQNLDEFSNNKYNIGSGR